MNMFKLCIRITQPQRIEGISMCEFTVYVDGHEDENIVAEAVIKAVVKPECVVLMNTSGKSVKVPNARITKVDTIMTELILETCGE